MLKAGDVVTDVWRESATRGKQGLVADVQLRFWDEPEILVAFDVEDFPYHLDHFEQMNEKIFFICSADHLRRDEDWAPEVYARRKFGSLFHSVRTLKAKLDPDKLCMVEGCPHNQTQVSWINIWGSVLNVYVCTEHAQHYETWSCMDSFPMRKESA